MNKIGAVIFTFCILIASASAQTDNRNAVQRLQGCITAVPIDKGDGMISWTLNNICGQSIRVFWGGPNIDQQDAEFSPGFVYRNAMNVAVSPKGTDAINWAACPSKYSPPDSIKLMGWSPENFDLDVCLPGFAFSLNERPPGSYNRPPPVRVAPSIPLDRPMP
jgi:hypothetical protein